MTTSAFREWVEKAKAVNIDVILRDRHISNLKGKGGKLAGPCPQCGGDDRFGVTLSKQAFHCRGCGRSGYGAISLVQFLDGIDFIHAVSSITGEQPPKDEVGSKTRQRKPASKRGPITAFYDYVDEQDTTLFQVVRHAPAEPGAKKSFRQRRPDPDRPGEWINNVDGVRLVPFRLPDLIEAISNEFVVYIVEGEKDVLTAAALGITATTNPMGIAKGWQASYNKFFEDADVVIIPDNDEDPRKGRAHAANISHHLRPIAARVRTLTLPTGKDLTEWVTAGGTLEQLQALTDHAAEYQNGNSKANGSAALQETPQQDEQPALPPTLTKIQFIGDFVPPTYIIEGMLQRGFIYALTGLTGHAKTAIALHIAQLICGPDPNAMLGSHKVEKGRVIYFAGENPDDVRMRIIGADSKRDLIDDDPTKDRIAFVPGAFDLKGIAQRLLIETQNDPAMMVVIDTSAVYFPGQDEQSNTQMGQYARMQRQLTQLPGNPTILALCHPIKHAADQSQLLPRGGGAYLNELDGNLTAWKSEDDLIELHHYAKMRGPGFEPITFQLERITCDRLVDAKGRAIFTVRAVTISQHEEARRVSKGREDEDLLLRMMLLKGEAQSLADLARACEWFTGAVSAQEPYKVKASRVLHKLEESKLVVKARDGWVLTDRGQKEARPIAIKHGNKQAAEDARLRQGDLL